MCYLVFHNGYYLLQMEFKNTAHKILQNIIVQIFALAAFFVLYHKYAVYVMTGLHIKLGAIGKDVAPLYATRHTDLTLWMIPAFAIFVVYFAIVRFFLADRPIRTWVLILTSILMLVAIDIAVAMMDDGLTSFMAPYTRTGGEYYGDVPKVAGVREFLHDYVKIFNNLSGHARTHPPGGVLFLYIVARVFGSGLLQAAIATVVFTSFIVIPVYFLARDLYGEKTARYAIALFLVAPNMVMFTATAMDGPFSVFPVLSIYLFYKSLSGKTGLYSILTGLALALAMLMNYTAVVIGIFFVTVAFFTLFNERKILKRAAKAMSIIAVSFAAFYVFLYFWAGYNIFSAAFAAYKKDQSSMGTGYENAGRYFNISIANLFAFLIGVGIPYTVIWLHEVAAELRRFVRVREADLYILPYFAALLITTFSTLFTLEVERIWIFMVPFVVIPGAKYLLRRRRRWEVYAVLGLTCVQLLSMEILLRTYW